MAKRTTMAVSTPQGLSEQLDYVGYLLTYDFSVVIETQFQPQI